MLTDLNTSVTDISPEQLDALFAETPDSTVTADNLTIGKDDVVKVGEPDIPEIDLDTLKEPAETLEEEEKEGNEKDKTPEGTDAAKAKKPADPAKSETPVDTSVLKTSIDYLIEKGIFKDFEGREDMEITEELYAEILEAQVSEIINERYGEKKASAGEYGEAILDYLENGGDPDQIIDLFKERKEVALFDISTEDAQRELVAKFYKEVYGWKPERIKKQLEVLALDEDGLQSEATEIKERYEDHYKKQADHLREEQAEQKRAYEAEQVRRKQAFETNIKKAISEYGVDDQRRKQLEQNLFKYRKLDDGSQVNEFYIKFAEWQNDPKRYVELVDFITNYDNYQKRKEAEIQTKVTEKTFRFVKGNQTASKNKGSEHVSPEEQAKHQGTNFSVIFKKK